MIHPIVNECNFFNLEPSQRSSMPTDIVFRIFELCKANLPTMALVSKTWKTLVDDKTFRQIIRPPQAFGVPEWKEYIDVDAGEELPLPRWAYGFIEKGNYMLTFVPKIVKVANEDGTTKDVALNSLDVIGQLAANPKKGSGIGYYHEELWDSWQDAIEEKRKEEESHWVFLSKEVMGRKMSGEKQDALAEKMEVRISGLVDTVVSLFMEYIRSKNCYFIWDPPINCERTWIRVYDITDNFPIGLAFAQSGLMVVNSWTGLDFGSMTFAPTRRSFGF